MAYIVLQEMDQTPNIVRCFDQMNRIWWNRMWTKSLLAILIFAGFGQIGEMLGSQLLQVVGFAIVAGGIVIPQIIRIHRGYISQICPSCGKEVGSYETTKNRIVLVCRHCDTRTPTDCSIYYAGGPPSKTP